MKDQPDWKTFVDKTKGLPPKPLLVEALAYCKGRDEALDLGAGALGDSIYLLSQGFRYVTAVDQENHVSDLVAKLPTDRFQFIESSFQDYGFDKEKFDLISAQYSLPFLPKEDFSRVFDAIKYALKPGGIYCGQFFGVNDAWNTSDSGMTFHRLEEVDALLEGMQTIKQEEKELDGITVSGEVKHWHLFDVIARKNSS